MAWPPVCCSPHLRSWGHKAINSDETAYWLDQIIPADLEFRNVEGQRLGLASLEGEQSLAVTCGFADVDTGLAHAEQGIDVRCELLTVARTGQPEVAAAVSAAAALLKQAAGLLPAQPGLLLPKLFAEDDERFAHFSVRHGMLIAPYLWGGQTPQLAEKERLTLVCQLLMLSDAEYAYAVEEGVPALQQAVAEQGIDLLDWKRSE